MGKLMRVEIFFFYFHFSEKFLMNKQNERNTIYGAEFLSGIDGMNVQFGIYRIKFGFKGPKIVHCTVY